MSKTVTKDIDTAAARTGYIAFYLGASTKKDDLSFVLKELTRRSHDGYEEHRNVSLFCNSN